MACHPHLNSHKVVWLRPSVRRLGKMITLFPTLKKENYGAKKEASTGPRGLEQVKECIHPLILILFPLFYFL